MAFSELNIASSGLFAAQQGLSVTSNNIANMNTTGYSRQVVGQQASTPLSGFGTGMIGMGVTTTGVSRVRDIFLDQKLWTQSASYGEYEVKLQQSSLLEGVFNEPSDDGFTKILTDMFNAIDDFSKDPTAVENASSTKQMMLNFTQYYNNVSTKFTEFQSDLNFEVKTIVEEINMLTARIQSLNEQIYYQEMRGDTANALRDQRDLCVDELSQLINVEVEEKEVLKSDGNTELQFVVKTDGQTLVNHLSRRTFELELRTDVLNEGDAAGLYDVVWSDGQPFDMMSSNLSGQLGGALDMRDGAGSPDYNGIPYYIDRLDEYVRTFSQSLNEIYNSDGNGGQMDPPQYMFSYTDAAGNIMQPSDPDFDYANMTAANFSISYELDLSAYNFRTNYEHVIDVNDSSNTVNPNPGNNDLLADLFGQLNNKDMFAQGSPSDSMIAIFSQLAINTQEADMYYNTQSNVRLTIENQRLSTSQVDTTEEFMNMVKYNQAYQMAAKIMQTMDGIYDITINKLGAW